LKSLLLLLFSFGSILSYAQNLIPNGSFEEYSQCPEQRETGSNGQFTRCSDWFYVTSPSIGTPDYYHRCNNYIGGSNQGLVGIPNHTLGYQEPFDGDGMVGFVPISIFAQSQNYEGMESITCELISELSACTEYKFRCQVNLSNLSEHAVSNLGVYFSLNAPILNDVSSILNIEPQIEWSQVISDTLDWVTLESTFIAKGNEKFMTFGYFTSKEETNWVVVDSAAPFPSFDYMYCYVDSMSLEYLQDVEFCSSSIPNVITPNNDQINDFIDISNYGVTEFIILNRWGNIVANLDLNNPIWDGTSKGQPCSDGVYFYKALFKEEEIVGTIQLIR